MAYRTPRIVWISDTDWVTDPADLSLEESLRFALTDECKAAVQLRRERRAAAGLPTDEEEAAAAGIVIRPPGSLLDDLQAGGPPDPERDKRMH